MCSLQGSEETERARHAMSRELQDMSPSGLLPDGETDTEEQLRLAGQFGNALLEENEELRQEIRRLRDRVHDSDQLYQDLRRSHGLELAQARCSFDSESFELQEQLGAVRQQLLTCERSRREKELRCAQKEEAVVSLEARVRSLEEEIERSACGSAVAQNSELRSPSREGGGAVVATDTSWWSQQESHLKEQIASLTEAQCRQSARVADLCRDKDKLLCTVEALEDQLAEALDRVEKQEEEVGELTQELEEAHRTLDDLRQEVEQQGTFSPFSTNTSIHEELVQVADVLSTSPGAVGTLHLGYQEGGGACLHCEQLEEELERTKHECTRLSNQVLLLVQQKLSLSQQVEAWEMDVETMVEGNINKQLQHDQRKSVRREQPSLTTNTMHNSSQKSWAGMLRSAFS